MALGTTTHPDQSGSGERPVPGALPQSSRGRRLGSSKGLPGTCDRWWQGRRPGVARWESRSRRPRPVPSAACAQAPPRARVTCGRGRGGPSRLRRLWLPARGREVGARTEEAETALPRLQPGRAPRLGAAWRGQRCWASCWCGYCGPPPWAKLPRPQVSVAPGWLVTTTRGWRWL